MSGMIFVYKLNEMESAACALNPFAEGFAAKRKSVIDHVAALNEQLAIKDAKFDRLCKDMDARNEHVDELKRTIANQRATLEEIARTSSSTRIRRLANEVLK